MHELLIDTYFGIDKGQKGSCKKALTFLDSIRFCLEPIFDIGRFADLNKFGILDIKGQFIHNINKQTILSG